MSAAFVGPISADMSPDRSGVDATLVLFVRYDPATGEIRERGRMAPSAVAHVAEVTGQPYLALPDATDDLLDPVLRYFVDVAGPRLMPKTPCPARLDGMVLRDLPQPCRIVITQPIGMPVAYPVAEAERALSFAHPGTYTVWVESVPHRTAEFEVTAP